jgi:bacterioferritin
MVRQGELRFEAPDDPSVVKILEQNIQGERCAIGFYKKLLESTQGKDPVTYNIILQILQDEVEHEEDLQSLYEDLEIMLKR